MTFLDTPPRLTENQFQQQVIRLAEMFGWRVYHTLDSRGSAAGFPDLVLCRARHRQPRILYAELKSDRGRLTNDQKAWLADLHQCGQEWYVWRPEDLETKIVRILR